METLREVALEHEVNLFYCDCGTVGLSTDECISEAELNVIAAIFAEDGRKKSGKSKISGRLHRTQPGYVAG